MRSERIVGAIGLCLCLSGCRLAADAAHNMVFETCLFANDVKGDIYYPMLARSAWADYCVDHGEARSSDFACGFKQGYADYLENGGDGTSHPLPPIRYWKIHKETPEGRLATERWLTGFREGTAAARTSGKRELIVVPIGGEPAAPPNGPPPGVPHPTVSPPAEPTDPLPPPRRLQSSSNNETPEGRRATERWLAGFLEGTAAARTNGKRQLIVVPLGGEPAALHNGPPPSVPHPKVSPPAEPTDPLPPPRRLQSSSNNAAVSTIEPAQNEPTAADGDLPALVSSNPQAPVAAYASSSSPARDIADYQGPEILGQTAGSGGYSKEENDLPRIVTGYKPAAAPSAPEVPLPPRDKTSRSAELQYQVAMVAMQAGAAEKALSWLYSALREDPNHIPSHKALMEYYQKTGDSLRAAEHRLKAGLPSDSEAANE